MMLTDSFDPEGREREGRREDRRGGLTPEPTENAMHPLIAELRSEIAEICRRFGVRRLALFGSAARLVDFEPEAIRRRFSRCVSNRRQAPRSKNSSRCATRLRRRSAAPSTSSSKAASAIHSSAPASSGRRRPSMDHDPRA